MTKLLLATYNRGKVREIQALLGDLGLELLTPADLGLELEFPENGATYAENAAGKALAFARASGLVALGDDSGLEVDALGGKPGLRSHRFAPAPNATDADRRAYLLQQLRGQPRPWTARFRATVAVADPGGKVHYAVGMCEGEIIPEERGAGGFGYDPIFLLPALGRTMAELGMDEKNRLSHRARAIQGARAVLRQVLFRNNEE
jgi:XTP/dITP diphosphohydrolase